MKKYYTGDIGLYIINGIFLPLLFVLLCLYGKQHFNTTMIIGLIVYIWFCASCVRIFKFKKNFYEVIFPFRVFKRRKTIFYSDIDFVEYDLRRKNQGQKCFHISRFGRKGWFYALRYDIGCDPKDAKPLMLFLKSKGIKIKIYSDKSLKEYEEILKDEEPEKRPSIEFRW